MNAATLAGSAAVLLWSTLALLTAGATRIPPLELLFLTFGVASVLGLAYALARRVNVFGAARRHPAALLLATAALGGYHFFYFVALAHAPVVDASLIAYLWPLLIVVFAAAAGGARVTRLHFAGAALGLAGAWLVIAARGALALSPRYVMGYGAALACALIWSAYSVANRRHASAPTELVALACALVALLAAPAHLYFETFALPSDREWPFILLLGAGPVGAAFFLWDHGTKHGRLALLGALSYAAPVLSTAFLIAAGDAAPTWHIGAGCVLVAGGAALAAYGERRVG
ncbi:MAG: DMT family transporter [Betaproteobacteria bacterium]|nr:DMT family transporter [Betaproteobacteria bacterium]